MIATQPRRSRLEVHERRWGWFFLSPWLVGLVLFTAFPMMFSLFLAFTDYNLVADEPLHFVGLRNWALLFSDPQMQRAFGNTLRYIVIVVPLLIASPFILALFLNAKSLWLKGLFITLFFLPQLIQQVVVGIIWQGTLSNHGPVNTFLAGLGIEGPMWLSNSAWVMPAIAVIGLWSIGNTVLQLMAALKAVPKELYEAALIDGANVFVTFFRITIPLTSSVLFYQIITLIIGGFQYFTISFLLFNGQGGPDDAGLFFMLKLFKEAIVYRNMGFASAMAWAMLIVITLITQVLFATSRRWVYYAGEVK